MKILGESIPNRRNSKCKSLLKRRRVSARGAGRGQSERRGVGMRLEVRCLGSPGTEKDFKLKTLGSHGRDLGRGWHSWICIFKFFSDNKSLGLGLTLQLTHCVILGQVPS